MATISYKITSGEAPFTAELTPSIIPIAIHDVVGTYEFNDVPNGNYTLIIVDSNGCVFMSEIVVDPLAIPPVIIDTPTGDAMIIGQTQDETQIFENNTTNRDDSYIGYPDSNIVTLYLWFKTSNGEPITSNKIINYRFDASGTTSFIYDSLSDEIHTQVIETISGPSNVMSGQITFSVGFIETFFKYTYIKDVLAPNYKLELYSSGNWLYPNIETTNTINQYGVEYIDNDNAIMKF